MSNSIPITGVPVKNYSPGDLPVRREISDLSDSLDSIGQMQWSLFVRALTHLASRPAQDSLGYFQLAVIYGEPRVPWNGVDPKGKFFSAHGAETFPTWNRAHLALFETMKEVVIPELKPRKPDDWEKAADTWRLPFWDFAKPQEYFDAPGLPLCFAEEHLQILRGDSSQEYVSSPFWSYTNPEKNAKGQTISFNDDLMGANKIVVESEIPLDATLATSRYGLLQKGAKTWDGLEGVNNWEAANDGMNHEAFYGIAPTTFTEAVNRLFTDGTKEQPKRWRDFACVRRLVNDHSNYMSLEYIHNNLHVMAGGSDAKRKGIGHLSHVEVAAFDPIFWLLQCNCDRLTAIWQAIYPTKWFDGPKEADAVAPTSGLVPFFDKSGTRCLTSNDVRDHRQLGYDYADLVPKGKSWDGSQIVVEKFSLQTSLHVKHSYPSTASIISRDEDMPDLFTEDKSFFHDYIIRVLYDDHALKGRSYTINFYLGAPAGKDSNEKNEIDNFAGSVCTFASNHLSQNDSRERKSPSLCSARILLTSRLVKRFKRDIIMLIRRTSAQNAESTMVGLGPENVEDYLKRNLTWEYRSNAGQLLDAVEFPRTEVAVLSGKGTKFTKDLPMPGYDDYRILYGATKGKPGGVSSA